MSSNQSGENHGPLWKMSLAALGVVFGDIGTSPLYAFGKLFDPGHGAAAKVANLQGGAALIVWTLILIVTLKYVLFILRLDNRGEGGILALAALIHSKKNCEKTKTGGWLIIAGILGAALIYADGILTPPISILAAMEGIVVSHHSLESYVVPGTIAVLIGLFGIQRFGTQKVGVLFGPIILLWFFVIFGLGIYQVQQNWNFSQTMAALNPMYAIQFVYHESVHAGFILAAVFLSVTGGEALYADLGHFGRRPIAAAWFWIVFPALVMNYLGQAALVSGHPEAASNPFFNMVRDPWVMPLTILAVCAAIIASQALISGAFSLTVQVIQLGCMPRLRIMQTSHTEKGQVYLPLVNWLLMIACILLVLLFKESKRLEGAYGVAIALTMFVTSTLFFHASHYIWGWKKITSGLACAIFLSVDICFMWANAHNIPHGGAMTLSVASVLMFLMLTWRWGRARSATRMENTGLPIDLLISQTASKNILRVPGLAIYMTGKSRGTPLALLHNLKHNHVLHENVMLLHVDTREIPRVPLNERCRVEKLESGFSVVHLNYGFSERPNVPRSLERHLPDDFHYNINKTTFFLGRETYNVSKGVNLFDRIRLSLFAWMIRNATPATAYFSLPPSRVVELGAQITL